MQKQASLPFIRRPDDHQKQAHNSGYQSPHLGQTDRLSRTGIPAIVPLLHQAARQSVVNPEIAATQKLVTDGDRDGAGAVLTRTVMFYAQWLASHERTHVKRIERIVKTMQT